MSIVDKLKEFGTELEFIGVGAGIGGAIGLIKGGKFTIIAGLIVGGVVGYVGYLIFNFFSFLPKAISEGIQTITTKTLQNFNAITTFFYNPSQGIELQRQIILQNAPTINSQTLYQSAGGEQFKQWYPNYTGNFKVIQLGGSPVVWFYPSG